MAVFGLGGMLEHALGLWLVALIAIVALKFLLHPEWLIGLARPGAEVANDEAPSTDRMQALVVVVFAAGWYGLDLVRAIAAADRPLTAIPEPKPALLSLLAASQGVYIAAKVARSFRR